MVHFKYLRWGIGIYGVLKAPTTWKSVKCKMVGYQFTYYKSEDNLICN